MTRSPANPVGAQLCASGRPRSQVVAERAQVRLARHVLEHVAPGPDVEDVRNALTEWERRLDRELGEERVVSRPDITTGEDHT